MPISKFQSDVLPLPAAQRRPDSYIAGGVAVNRQGPRFSGDIGIFPDSIERLPTQPDELFGYVLHPVNLATNKASAAADRRVPLDIVSFVTMHESILPLGAVVAATVGKFPGTTPEEMPAEITPEDA